MKEIIECVPNISEGRRKEVVEEIIGNLKKLEVKLLDYSSDEDHNRTVITFVGGSENVVNAAVQVARDAVRLIDLRSHKGAHPRMGAVDVIPFIPVKNVTMRDCIEISKRVGKIIGEELGVPVYLYAESAKKEARRLLPEIRRGEFEGFFEKIKDPEWTPDYGPQEVNPTAGVTAVGAREFLIAYNINLSTKDISIAKKIARSIRESSGGLRYIQAREMPLDEKGCVQVSINILNYKKAPIYRIFEIVKMEADRFGVSVLESELVGLMPMKAALDSLSFYLQFPELNEDQILETKIYE
ncbi:MAG: glutamate formimidoyltransferase [Caldiserica bacterium CG02_land_8_20_14_3_00_36_38]|nr:glutamate formimidoyltransferase [Caldisericota bacterium]OIP13530.1 MAG: glutamate formimidoyltransferase [Caldisericum sp. CG2_30_36_11]PIP50059.1 MAG: glutamate formimidoyltransferase [Caldiserica bacterium CG23_combo_of_CG06-09_8_20_14_all_35_60]PIV56002.1 MAG: glutamate formimidoyltransferase [Caldiserica bacterium CG02_land_8_20_14_3_00_36_38]PIW10633.1 MAG: glutamate formimidoyltransferase [Caldiserica bacterium CG17_big_fil_post_rev_8_21_14_2_50_35_7]PIX28378.1 MAG: glutamate formim